MTGPEKVSEGAVVDEVRQARGSAQIRRTL